MLLAERSPAPERMDDPSLDGGTYATVLAHLARINRLTLAYRPTLRFLDKATRDTAHLRLLDVGFGQGDMLRQIARWCAARGMEADLVGVDLNPRSVETALAVTPPDMPIRYVPGDYLQLRGTGFDCIVSSLVAHHMTRAELLRFLFFMNGEARLGWFVNDLRRSVAAWLGFPLLASLARTHPIVRQDGMTSIARSFRETEWQALLREARIEGAEVVRRFPFRLCVQRIP